MIIRSFCDTDLYKITMGQAVFNNYPRIGAEYEFINRGQTKFPERFAIRLKEEVSKMSKLALTREEKAFLEKRCGHYLKPTFLDWLAGYRFDPDEVSITQEGGDLRVVISGSWYRTIYWEVPLMALISELYFKMSDLRPTGSWKERVCQKGLILKLARAQTVEFGTRRRFSYAVQDSVIKELIESAGKWTPGGDGVLRGTSNVHLAAKYDLTPFGTHAHEWFQAHAAMFGYWRATEMALEAWAKEFGGHLGIALSDTFTTDDFLGHFNAFYARLFDGIRQDSGDPLVILEKVIKHYTSEKIRIDPTTKTFVASDGLDMAKVGEIQAAALGRIRTLYGIGTNLTNDVGHKPLNMVIKLHRITLADGRVIPVVKLSDDKGKISGDKRAINAALWELGLSNRFS